MSEIFTSKKTLAFGGFKRVATLIASLPLFIATAVFTATLPGKEIVWEFWLTISLTVSGFQITNLFAQILFEMNHSR